MITVTLTFKISCDGKDIDRRIPIYYLSSSTLKAFAVKYCVLNQDADMNYSKVEYFHTF